MISHGIILSCNLLKRITVDDILPNDNILKLAFKWKYYT